MVSVADGVLTVNAPSALAVRVVEADGRTVYGGTVSSLRLPLRRGTYVVTVGGQSRKIAVAE